MPDFEIKIKTPTELAGAIAAAQTRFNSVYRENL